MRFFFGTNTASSKSIYARARWPRSQHETPTFSL